MSSSHNQQGGLQFKTSGYPVLTTGPLMASVGVPQTKVSIRPGPNMTIPGIPGTVFSPSGVVSPRPFGGVLMSPAGPGGIIGGPSVVAAKASEFAPGGILSPVASVDLGTKSRPIAPIRAPLMIPGAMSPIAPYSPVFGNNYRWKNKLRRLKRELENTNDRANRRDIRREMRDILAQVYPSEFMMGAFDDVDNLDKDDKYFSLSRMLSDDNDDDWQPRVRRFGRNRRRRRSLSLLDALDDDDMYGYQYYGAGVLPIFKFQSGGTDRTYVLLSKDAGGDFVPAMSELKGSRWITDAQDVMHRTAVSALKSDTNRAMDANSGLMDDNSSFDIKFGSGRRVRAYILQLDNSRDIALSLTGEKDVMLVELRALTDAAEKHRRDHRRSDRGWLRGSTEMIAFPKKNIKVHNSVLAAVSSDSFEDALRNADGKSALLKEESKGKWSLNVRSP